MRLVKSMSRNVTFLVLGILGSVKIVAAISEFKAYFLYRHMDRKGNFLNRDVIYARSLFNQVRRELHYRPLIMSQKGTTR